MISVNKVTLVGHLGADPETKGRDSSFVTMSVATSRSHKDRESGDRVTVTEWHKVVVFDDHCAKFAKDYLKKGDMVYVEGRLETRKWEKEPGNTVYFTEVIVHPYGGVLQSISKDRNGRTESGRDSRESGTGERRESGTERRESARASDESRTGRSGNPFSRSSIDDDIPFMFEWR